MTLLINCKLLHSSIDSLFHLNSPLYALRSNIILKIPKIKIYNDKFNIRYKGPLFWNSLEKY